MNELNTTAEHLTEIYKILSQTNYGSTVDIEKRVRGVTEYITLFLQENEKQKIYAILLEGTKFIKTVKITLDVKKIFVDNILIENTAKNIYGVDLSEPKTKEIIYDLQSINPVIYQRRKLK